MTISSGLLERDELGRRGGTNTRATVAHRLVGDRELAKVVSDHVSLDLNGGEDLAVVYADNAANHLRDDNHVTKVGLDDFGLVVRATLLLGLEQLRLELLHWPLEEQTTREAPACARMDNVHQLLGGHVEQSIEVGAAEGELAECALLLQRRDLLIGLVDLRVRLQMGARQVHVSNGTKETLEGETLGGDRGPVGEWRERGVAARWEQGCAAESTPSRPRRVHGTCQRKHAEGHAGTAPQTSRGVHGPQSGAIHARGERAREE